MVNTMQTAWKKNWPGHRQVVLNMELDSMYENGNLEEAVQAAQLGLRLCKELQDSCWWGLFSFFNG